MKTLRLIRNIAVLFILVMGLLTWKPELGVSRADHVKQCQYKPGYAGCNFKKGSGTCTDQKCNGSNGAICSNVGCV